ALDNGITSLQLQQVFDNEAACAAQGFKCDPQTQGAVVRSTDNAVNFVFDPTINAVSIRTSGLDLDARYQLRAGAIGNFGFDLVASRALSFKQKSDPSAPEIEFVDSLDYPRFRLTTQANWTLAKLSAAVFVHYVPGQRDC